MNPLLQRKPTILPLFIAGVLACFGLLPKALAVVPPPDGGYPNFNTAEGQNALFSLTTGVANTGVGWYSLWSNIDGSYNTAVGVGTLLFNIGDQSALDGVENTAVGAAALLFNTIGSDNTATGVAALLNNTEGNNNTATGIGALLSNITGVSNTADGSLARFENTTGFFNTANGRRALQNNTTGFDNTADGYQALFNNTAGAGNTALGRDAGFSITGDGNVCIGQGVDGVTGVDNTTYIRNVNTLTQNFSAGVNDYVTVRLSDGRLGHTAVVSSQRYKQDIQPLAATSQALYALKPVSFRLKKEFDPTQALGFGLIAEEVEKVDPALVYRNAKGQVESVRYEMVNAMLLNEFLKENNAFLEEQRTVEEQEKTIAEVKSNAARQEATISELRRDMAVLTAQFKEQAAQIRQVSAQIEMKEHAPQIVSNSP